MAEGAKFRVVRCPKCEKLLLELPDNPVYRCGGCDTTLQARRQKPSQTDTPSEKSEDAQLRVCENSQTLSEENTALMNEASETDQKRERMDFRKKDSVFPDRTTNFNNNVSPGTENETTIDATFRDPSKAPVDRWVPSKTREASSDELIKTNTDGEGKLKAQVEESNEFGTFRQKYDRHPLEREGLSAFRRTPRALSEGVEFSKYPEVGPSNYHQDPAYGFVGPLKNQKPESSDRAELLEQGRAELLRKLDELRDQLTRSCDVSEKTTEWSSANRRVVPSTSYKANHRGWFHETSSESTRISSQFLPADDRRPPLFQNDTTPLSRHDLDARSFYPPVHAPTDQILGYGDHFGGSQMLKGVHPKFPQFPRDQSKDCLPGQYSSDADPMVLYPRNAFSCSCLNCHSHSWQVPGPVPPPVFGNQELPNSAANHMLYHVERPAAFGLGAYDYRAQYAPIRACAPAPHVRNPSDSGFGMFRRSFPNRSAVGERAMVAKENRRKCHPTAGGAPFITCCNCSELLQLPKKFSTMKHQQKMRCGACSEIISFVLDGKRVVFTFPTLDNHIPSEISNDSGEMMKEGGLNSQMEERIIITSDDDPDQLTDGMPMMASPNASPNATGDEQLSNFSGSERLRALSPSSISSEESPDSMATQRNGSNLNADLASSLPSSPPRDQLDYSPTNRIGSKFGKGSRSKRSVQEKIVTTKGSLNTSRQNSVKDVSVATEMVCSYNEYPNSGMSQDSEEVSKEEDRSRISKGGESFFAGIIKKSFKDFGRSNQLFESGKSSVFINGQPISDRVVKKAGKQAGPIQPGQYWYDYRAGFWGVMGQPCVGIIPSFIEEFNFPMPKNCSGGATGIFVNGRELHQRDLDLLASRGLPLTRDKSYIIEISGRVFDEASGDELDSLGRLAPTVEKVKHGFGMRVPRGMA
ncbi:protein ENHANCED DISEASE RESISTANCE 4-like [Aristolochia californica]|uniref:protein ENHANCED DISEASE RESISTANCE 4-like n=1 Tax=Aristolochia californica TaxID=171875 RepID=UPI0035D6DA8A